MSKEAARKSMQKLFDEKDRLSKEQPAFTQSYSQFLRDWERYSKSQEILNRTKELDDYLIFGVLPRV